MGLVQSIANSLKSETGLEQRLERAKKHAKAIVNAEVDTEQDLFDVFRKRLSDHYRIPFLSDYFQNLTFDDIALEYFLIVERPVGQQPVTKELIDEHKDELAEMFKDDEDEKYEEVDELKADEKAFLEQNKEFFKTGFAAPSKKEE